MKGIIIKLQYRTIIQLCIFMLGVFMNYNELFNFFEFFRYKTENSMVV